MAEGFTPGIYTLFNKSVGKVVEFQPKDGSVSAGTFRPGKTQQQWEFIPVNGNFAIRCMLPATDGHRVYLSLGGDMRDGQAVRAESHPLLWRVSRRDDMIRLFFTNNFCLDLDHHSHHKIHIVQCKEHEGLQLWHPSWDGPLHYSDIHIEQALHPCTREPAPVTTPQTIQHVATGTRLDLRGDDRRSVVCVRADHKEPNQQWTCFPSGQNGCVIQSGARSFSGEPLYLTVEGIAQEGAAIVATPYPVSWNVRHQMTDNTKTTFRFYWPGTNFVMVWAVRFSPDIQGTPVQLGMFGKWGDSDLWRMSPLP